MLKFIFYLAVIYAIYTFSFADKSVTHTRGVKAPKSPVQIAIGYPRTVVLKGHKLTFLADYSINAKILSRERYYFGPETALSPFDFALGWGAMSDQFVVDQLDIGQSGRWFRWSYDEKPTVPVKELEQSCANTHIIPANDYMERKLKAMKRGEIISLQGKLVRVESPDGWEWKSSLSRKDTGDGACEVFLVESGYIVK